MTNEKTILAALGYDTLAPMQEAMHEACGGEGGVVLLSPTGSGKTLAYLLPLVECIDVQSATLQAVVIVPTRELAVQSEDLLKRMQTGVRALSLYGGRPAMQEHRTIREVKPQVVFVTPGRLTDHLSKENLNGFGVRLLVVDEFDKCLELGFHEEMERALSHLPAIERLWLMSATDAEEIPAFVSRVMPRCRRLDFLGAGEKLASRVQVFEVKSPLKDKLECAGRLLTYLDGTPAIIFVNHRESVERVGTWLAGKGFAVAAYHGGMEQEQRERTLYKFRNGSANVLVSTDLAARGLDIADVGAVIHYHLPLKEEEYTHRNGRTARWNAGGKVYLLIGPEEHLPLFASQVQELALSDDAPIRPAAPRYATLYIGRGKRDKLSRADVLGFLCKKGGLRSADIGRIDVGAHAAYAAVLRTQVKSVLQQVAGEKIKGMKTLIEEAKK